MDRTSRPSGSDTSNGQSSSFLGPLIGIILGGIFVLGSIAMLLFIMKHCRGKRQRVPPDFHSTSSRNSIIYYSEGNITGLPRGEDPNTASIQHEKRGSNTYLEHVTGQSVNPQDAITLRPSCVSSDRGSSLGTDSSSIVSVPYRPPSYTESLTSYPDSPPPYREK